MNKYIKRFCEGYKQKLKNDKEISERPKDDILSAFNDFTERITFSVNMREWSPGIMYMGQYNGTNLIALDEEDLKYLYNKYSKKIKDEMNKNISSIKKEYGEFL